MEKAYWLRRKRDELTSAESATSAEARLIHFDLAGRYSVKANNAAIGPGIDRANQPANLSPIGNVTGKTITGEQHQQSAAPSDPTAHSAAIGENSAQPSACQPGRQPL